MRVAEALSLRSDLRTRITRQGQLLVDSVVSEEDAEPVDFPKLVAEFNSLRDSLLLLERRIHTTNEQYGLTLIRLNRDMLIKASEVLRLAARQTTSEWAPQRHADRAQLRQSSEDFARQARELDNQLQEANWTTELVE